MKKGVMTSMKLEALPIMSTVKLRKKNSVKNTQMEERYGEYNVIV